jgi:hypothetical protein
MKNVRSLAALAVIPALLLLGCSHSASTTSVASASPSGPSAAEDADIQVCAAVGTVGTDWKAPSVAALAISASSYVRDAYVTAASTPMPSWTNWDPTYATWKQAMNKLDTVCAAVRAKGA